MQADCKTLMIYRLKEAEKKLKSSRLLLDQGFYKDSLNRSYYAIFLSMRAILALDGIDFKKHTGVISYFQREYIKTGIFDKKISGYVMDAFQIRNNADYEDFYIVSVEDTEEQYQHALEVFNLINEYLTNRLKK